MDYEADRPKFKARSLFLWQAFSRLNRRRVEYRPLQKSDILQEVKLLPYPDLSLFVIEKTDNEWLEIQREKIKRKTGAK